MQQVAIIGGVADQHRAKQFLAALADHRLLVNASGLIHEHGAATARGVAVRITDGRDIHAHQFELGAHIGTLERFFGLAHQVLGSNFRHLVARRHQTKDTAIPQCHFTDGVNIFI